VFAHQIPAGLNFCLSGIPYWATDIGAFFVPGDQFPGGSKNEKYRELFTRWFQYGAFCPIFRVHGTDTPKEFWRFGPEYEPILVKYDRLRYKLMPYIYSQAWQVTHAGSTLMRALVMDFPNDVTARGLKDEFMFGPSILVAPVIHPGEYARRVYLPAGTSWYNFWTEQKFKGGQWITTPSPIDTLPLFVKEGSILPLGPDVQYANQRTSEPIQFRVYPGANAQFTLYEDEGDNYNYEKGQYTTREIAWENGARTLTVSKPKGKYPGMRDKFDYKVVIVK
jgi:alpha-D-xyloside xylohydrolase